MEAFIPKPDEVARKAAGGELRNNHKPGKLKIFFGYASGSGKTYAMLNAAHKAKALGIDVAVGSIASQAPEETLALLNGLELIPPCAVPHNGAAQKEFDLDGALARYPELILVDRLAHTNAEGSRHLKRYQDVEELLRAGINVYTTVNVENLESLNDIILAITGVAVSDRIPDRIFDAAAQVQFVDCDPSELSERLITGKTDRETQLRYASGRFAAEKKLTSLREVALRRMADRVSRSAIASSSAATKTGEHLLICLSASPSNAKVIRTAARMAEAFHGEFSALIVETPEFQNMDESDSRRLHANMRLAEELGARITTVYGDDPAIQIAEYAQISGISKIVLGRSIQKKRLFSARKSLMDKLSELAPDLDIYIIPDKLTAPSPHQPWRLLKEHVSIPDLIKMIGILSACTALGYIFLYLGFTTANIIMCYILAVIFIAMVTSGQIYSLLASVLSVLIFNFFFTLPYFTFMSDPNYVATFGIMFIVAFISSSLTTRIKRQAIESAQKAYRTEVLLETSQMLQQAEDENDIISVTATQLLKLLSRSVLFYPVTEDGTMNEPLIFSKSPLEDSREYFTAYESNTVEWVRKNNKHAGATTGTLPGAICLYMAVRGKNSVLAVAGIRIKGTQIPDAFEKNMIVAILDECGLALEKERLRKAKQKIEEAAKHEALRSNLLRAISHDLRTPLTTISGNAGVLMEKSAALDDDRKQRLYTSIYDDAMWLIDLVENLLSITRFENGAAKLKTEPDLLYDVFQEALSHLDRKSSEHHISLDLQDDFLMADMDSRLIAQVVINLINNAIKYTPSGSDIVVSAFREGENVLVSVADDGPGIPDDVKDRLFEMFYTANNARGDGRRGLGLGLSLCKSIVSAHGGTIAVTDNKPHGSRFIFTLHASEVTSHE
ncbi:MAG: DUF4118 domain-containing protein [Oscillospiraceae bacterium]